MNELTEEIISNIDNLSINEWLYLCFGYNLSEDFIRKYQDKVDWRWICRCQTLSEDLIREFQDKVDWLWISFEQVLSEEFLREFEDKIEFYNLLRNKQLSNYSKETQRFILGKVIKYAKGTVADHYYYLTKYMKEEYERLSIML